MLSNLNGPLLFNAFRIGRTARRLLPKLSRKILGVLIGLTTSLFRNVVEKVRSVLKLKMIELGH